MWRCKRCGCGQFYQHFKGTFLIFQADKDENITESDNGMAVYGKFHCGDCTKSGWTLSEVAKWEEDEE